MKKFIKFVLALILAIFLGGSEQYQLTFRCFIDQGHDHITFETEMDGQSLGINGTGLTDNPFWGYVTVRNGQWVLTPKLPLDPERGIIQVRIANLTPLCMGILNGGGT